MGWVWMLFAFGPFELDLAARELRRDGHSIPLQPRVFGALRYLVEHRDRVVAKQELIDALWGGNQLNSVAVPWTINRARNALGRDASDQPLIETVRGHGYRFVGDVRQSVAEPDARMDSAATAAQRARVLPRRRGDPFVGRDHVLAQLALALEASSEGRGGLYLLTGEAGIGKTRCAEEFAELARRRGLNVWWGRSFESGGAPAFWPFIQVLRAAVSDPSMNDLARRECQALLAEFEPRSPDASSTTDEHLPAADARFWLLDRLNRWLCRSATSQVRVVVLDDVHGADESSLRALALLAPLLPHSRVIVVATARDAASTEPERSVSRLATRLCPSERIALTGLPVSEVEIYLTTALGERRAAQLAATLHARTAGNPLFMREAIRALREQLERDSSIRSEDVRIPTAAKEIISDRLLALDADQRALLDTAAVIGEEFELPLLQHAAGVSGQAALAALQVAALGNIVEARADGFKYAFVHPLMREILYTALPPARRAQLHAAVGAALEAYEVIEPRINEVAYHFHLSPSEPYYERAARYARRAGDAAMRVLAYADAVRFYAWALEAQPHVPSATIADACTLLLASAAANVRACRRAEWRRQCEQAIALAREAKLPDILVRAARLLRPSVSVARVPDPIAVGALETALALLPESASALRAHACSQLASLPPYSWRVDLSRQMSDQAARLAEQLNDPALRLEAQRSRLHALSGPDSTDALLQVTSELLQSDPERASATRADAHVARYHALLREGDVDAADTSLAAFGKIGRMLRLPSLTWQYERFRAQRLMHAGGLDQAERRFAELLVEGQRLSIGLVESFHAAQTQALNVYRTGKYLSAATSEPRAVNSAVQQLAAYRAHRLTLAIETGALALAEREFRALAAQRFAAVSGDSTELSALVQLASAAIALGDRAEAEVLRDLLEPHAERIALSVFTLSRGCVARYVGLLERFLGRRPQARAQFETAIAVNGRTGHELQRLRASLELAELLAEGNSRTDLVRARALAVEAGSTAERCGAHALSAAAARMIAGLPPPSVTPHARRKRRSLRPSAR